MGGSVATHYQIFSHSLKQNIKTGILNRILITFYHLQLIFGDFFLIFLTSRENFVFSPIARK